MQLIRYSVILLLLSIGKLTLAVPAPKIIHELFQASGVKFEAYLIGDEHCYFWETKDGYTILFDEKTHNWYYATKSKDGTLIKSNILAHEDPPKNLKKHSRPDKFQKDPAKRPLEKFQVPTVGTINIPVLLINFKNTTYTFTPAKFKELLFAPHKHSMTNYYSKVSYGRLKVTGEVIGWLSAKENHSYYGEDREGRIDVNVGKLIEEAILRADERGVDFKKYAIGGTVPTVMVVHQGRGQELSGSSTDIWSHMATLENVYADGCRILSYTIQPELIRHNTLITIGVFCHELGHVLGLPDLYDRRYLSRGLGDWSLMAAGAWGKYELPGDSPTALDAWCKKELGWVNVVRAADKEFSVDNSQTNNTVYKILPKGYPPENPEYFLVENRKKADIDRALPGSGILIYHIDETRRRFQNDWPGPYLVALEQADGDFHLEWNRNGGDEYDPWYVGNPKAPKLKDAVVFSNDPTVLPNSRLNNGADSQISIMITSPPTDTMHCIATGSITLRIVMIAYPNPWIEHKHKDKKITFKVKDHHLHKVKIYDICGALVAELTQKGSDAIEFSPNKLATGLYIAVGITFGGKISTAKFCVIK